MEKLIAKTREMTTAQILEAVMIIGGATGAKISTEVTMVRAALIEVYMEREGEDAADTLMESIGL